MSWAELERRAESLVPELGAVRLRELAGWLAQGWSPEVVRRAEPRAAPLLEAVAALPEPGPEPALAYLRGVAAGYARRGSEAQVESVWSGPGTHRVPVRAMAQVLTSLVEDARTELVLTTYSARPYPPLLDALTQARARGVAVTIVVETLQGAGSALAGAEPHQAFAEVPGVEL
ncbi:hypothetical protein RIF23_16195 [Lipingzhangella sp. LS1_29]|uniref:Phospholipase D-like domain-containing protein n=1 Tax=Lipingzhangella rawalii TaxID=2055835 RepID=A0ABU2HAH0_9ACTN|nr:hypothetical protein [Lipingzhangella rawalii]MDS1271835.1 hypothetical protein [Lipingzhangella rawalii]